MTKGEITIGDILEFENEMRGFISSLLKGTFGDKWWKQRVPSEIKKNVINLRSTKRKNDPIHAELITNEELLHLGDLKQIVENRANWNEVFGQKFVRKEQFVLEFEYIITLRNYLAHGNTPPKRTIEQALPAIDKFREIIGIEGDYGSLISYYQRGIKYIKTNDIEMTKRIVDKISEKYSLDSFDSLLNQISIDGIVKSYDTVLLSLILIKMDVFHTKPNYTNQLLEVTINNIDYLFSFNTIPKNKTKLIFQVINDIIDSEKDNQNEYFQILFAVMSENKSSHSNLIKLADEILENNPLAFDTALLSCLLGEKIINRFQRFIMSFFRYWKMDNDVDNKYLKKFKKYIDIEGGLAEFYPWSLASDDEVFDLFGELTDGGGTLMYTDLFISVNSLIMFYIDSKFTYFDDYFQDISIADSAEFDNRLAMVIVPMIRHLYELDRVQSEILSKLQFKGICACNTRNKIIDKRVTYGKIMITFDCIDCKASKEYPFPMNETISKRQLSLLDNNSFSENLNRNLPDLLNLYVLSVLKEDKPYNKWIESIANGLVVK